MYIKRIELKNIRCFEHIEIDLTTADNVRKWAVILGDNGVGKTTLLRSIAMGLGDRETAAALLRDVPGEWVRRQSPDDKATIRIDFFTRELTTKPCFIQVTISNDQGRETISEHQTSPDKFPWDDVFACGYGAGRGTSGTTSYERYRTIDSLYTLFNYETPLQNAELILLRLNAHTAADIDDILHSIDDILMLPRGSTRADKSGISISGPWGRFMPMETIGDGYKATLVWLVDLLGWAMFQRQSIMTLGDIGGIVLIDEFEQHLHPRWQRQIIRLLHKQFSNTQFIGTTHSPLCASGTADLDDENVRLFLLRSIDDNGAVKGSHVESLRGLRADQVLTSPAFSLPETRNPEIGEQLQRFRELLFRESLPSREEAELKRLRSFVEQRVPGLAEREEDRALERRLSEWLLSMNMQEKKSDR